jgi:hypothetical protein
MMKISSEEEEFSGEMLLFVTFKEYLANLTTCVFAQIVEVLPWSYLRATISKETLLFSAQIGVLLILMKDLDLNVVLSFCRVLD